jgi:hypothetical protein
MNAWTNLRAPSHRSRRSTVAEKDSEQPTYIVIDAENLGSVDLTGLDTVDLDDWLRDKHVRIAHAGERFSSRISGLEWPLTRSIETVKGDLSDPRSPSQPEKIVYVKDFSFSRLGLSDKAALLNALEKAGGRKASDYTASKGTLIRAESPESDQDESDSAEEQLENIRTALRESRELGQRTKQRIDALRQRDSETRVAAEL